MYAMYLRRSREDKDLEKIEQGETLARQRKKLQDLAKTDGYKVTKVYEEIVSGSSIDDRPEMQKLLIEIRMGKYKGVLVSDISRLARGSMKDQGIIIEAFVHSNTLIVTPKKVFDPQSKMDKEFFEYFLFFSQKEYDFITSRLQGGIESSFNEGNYVGSIAPYGYNAVRINKKERILVPNDKSKYVEMIFSWYVKDNMTAGQIARKLTSMSIPTPSGKKRWSRETVKDIVKNHYYIGKNRWGKRKKEKVFYEDGTYKKVKRRNADVKIGDGKHEAIISEDIFILAQSLTSSKLTVKHEIKLQNSLARLIYCKNCGRAMNYSRNRGNPRFIHSEAHDCKMKSAKYDDVIEALAKELKVCITDFEFKKTNNNEAERHNDHMKMIKDMKASLTKLHNNRTRLFEAFEDGTYDKVTFNERREINDARIEELEAAIDREELNLPVPINYEEHIIRFSQAVETLTSDEFEPDKKNQFLKTMIDKIEYECDDLGRNKGGVIKLSVYLRE